MSVMGPLDASAVSRAVRSPYATPAAASAGPECRVAGAEPVDEVAPGAGRPAVEPSLPPPLVPDVALNPLAEGRGLPAWVRVGARLSLLVSLTMVGTTACSSGSTTPPPQPAVSAVAMEPAKTHVAIPTVTPVDQGLLAAEARDAVAALDGLLATGTPAAPVSIPVAHTVQDPVYVHPGSTLYLEDLQQRIRELSDQAGQAGTPADSIPAVETIRLLESAKRLHPQAVKFQVAQFGDTFQIHPVDWSDRVEVKSTVRVDSTVVGGELESLVTAMRLASHGQKVALVYAGPLGGLSSDEGGNMRYFDNVGTVARTPEQVEIFEKAFASPDGLVIPDGVDARLAGLLKANYPTIRLVHTETLNSLHVEQAKGRLGGLVTQEGVRIQAGTFVGADPDGILAEKAGLLADTQNVVHLSYGVVFDLQGISDATLAKLAGPHSVEDVCRAAGTTSDRVRAELGSHPSLKAAWDKFEKTPQEAWAGGPHSYWGDYRVAVGFDLYSRIQELRDPSLGPVNDSRVSDGFNVAVRRVPGSDKFSATFNSISYQMPKAFHQGDHDIAKDPDLAFLRDDLSRLQTYFRAMTGEKGLTVRAPHEMYVRKSTRIFQTEEMRGLDSILTPQSGATYRFAYALDGRGTRSVNAMSDAYFSLDRILHGGVAADVTAAQARTGIENFYVIGKDAGFKAEATPWARILQQQMDVGATLADHLATKTPLPPLQGSTGSLPASVGGLGPILEKMESLRTYEKPDAGLGAHERAALEQLRSRLEAVARHGDGAAVGISQPLAGEDTDSTLAGR